MTVAGLADKPSKVSLLADGRSLDAAIVDGQLAITVPAEAPDKNATVVALDL